MKGNQHANRLAIRFDNHQVAKPGHQSVVVSRADGVDVIAGQAVYYAGELDAEESIEPLSEAEADKTRLRRLPVWLS